MEKNNTLKTSVAKSSASVLQVLAEAFASSACMFKMYEPEIPSQLKK